MSNKKFWKWSNVVDSNGDELVIDGVISSESWWGDEVTPKELRDELKQHKGDLTVVLNSVGGDVFAGMSMYNALREYDGKVTIRVDGLAASIASVIAMAGDDIVMSPGSMMMIHKPSVFAMGDSNDLEKAKEMLMEIEDSIIPIYTDRTGLSVEEVTEMMEEETWMSAERAVELGFADKLISSKKPDLQEAVNKMSFAFSMSAAKEPLDDFVKKLHEDKEANMPKVKETEKVEPKNADTEFDVKANIDDVNEKLKEIETKMSKQEEIAQSQVLEPKAQADPQETPKASMKDYLKTKASMEAFARILEANPGSGHEDTASAEKVRNEWKKHLEATMGVTNPEIFLPTPLIQEIEDAFAAGGEIWNRLSKTGMDSFNAAWDANTDPEAETGRAAGYNRADEEEKREQELTLANRILRPQMVYKYITLNREDVKEQRSTGALVRFVLSELPRRIVREIERAVILGDGRAPGSDYKIQEGNPRGFYPVLADAVAGNVFASTYTVLAGEDNYAAVVKANDLLEAEGRPVLVAKKGFVTNMKLSTNANGGYIFPLGANFAEILGVAAIVEPDWFNDTSAPDVDAVLVVLDNYRVVGDQSIEAFQNFLLKTNKNEYLQEIWAGGGLTSRKSAVAIAQES